MSAFDAALKAMNDRTRLEICLSKFLVEQKGHDLEAIKAALTQAKGAQQDTDFQPLWDLLDSKPVTSYMRMQKAVDTINAEIQSGVIPEASHAQQLYDASLWFSDVRRMKMAQMHAEGVRVRDIANTFCITSGRVSQILAAYVRPLGHAMVYAGVDIRVPNGAKWLAMDRTGYVYSYSGNPVCKEGIWIGEGRTPIMSIQSPRIYPESTLHSVHVDTSEPWR